MLRPNYIFESSWEVCNKVGGIYTVLSTRAKTLQEDFKDCVIFVGPSFDNIESNHLFEEDCELFPEWKKQASSEGISVRIGRWAIPGNPIVFLVDFKKYFDRKNDIYKHLWEDFQVDSLHAYGDYDEASMFSYAAALVVESFCRYYTTSKDRIIYHANEWMTGLGLLYLRKNMPHIATVFTTHATSIGRSIAGNNKPLYNYLEAYDGDIMANELNMQSKHSIEKQTAIYSDCFTTVSDITARECSELLAKDVDIVLPNGFDDSFVPEAGVFEAKRKQARAKLLEIASRLSGEKFDEETFIISTSGRYEFKNKGIDVFIEAVNKLRFELKDRKVAAFIEVPAWVKGPRRDLQEGGVLKSGSLFVTHELHDYDNDRILGMVRNYGMTNNDDSNVRLFFIPCYLDGNDGIFNMSYYDMLLANDLCVYPSYYEPWGYTPLEAIAFKVPCITTDLAGFGMWVKSQKGYSGLENDGVEVVHRDDYNYFEVAEAIKNTVIQYVSKTDKERKRIREKAYSLSHKALWSKFITYYYRAYDIALTKAAKRI